MITSAAGHSATVSRLVLEPRLYINYQDENGYTAAHHATIKGRTECLRILAQTERVWWNRRIFFGWTPLFMAVLKGHFDILDIIVKQPNINYTFRCPNTTLEHEAVRSGNVKCVETLAAHECQYWNVPDWAGYTPIMRAAMEDKTEIVKVHDSISNLLIRPYLKLKLTPQYSELSAGRLFSYS